MRQNRRKLGATVKPGSRALHPDISARLDALQTDGLRGLEQLLSDFNLADQLAGRISWATAEVIGAVDREGLRAEFLARTHLPLPSYTVLLQLSAVPVELRQLPGASPTLARQAINDLPNRDRWLKTASERGWSSRALQEAIKNSKQENDASVTTRLRLPASTARYVENAAQEQSLTVEDALQIMITHLCQSNHFSSILKEGVREQETTKT